MRQLPIKLRRAFPSHAIMMLQTMLEILNGIEGSEEFQEDEDLQQVVGQFIGCLNLRYQSLHWEMKQSGDYTYPEYLRMQPISERLRREFQPIYEIHQERMRYTKPE